VLYSSYHPKDKMAERMGKKMTELVQSISKKPIPDYAGALVFELLCDGEDGEDLDVPYVKYNFRVQK